MILHILTIASQPILFPLPAERNIKVLTVITLIWRIYNLFITNLIHVNR